MSQVSFITVKRNVFNTCWEVTVVRNGKKPKTYIPSNSAIDVLNSLVEPECHVHFKDGTLDCIEYYQS